MIKQVIEASKYVINQKHSIKALVKQIKSFGLDSNTPKEVLVDVIMQLQNEKLY